MKHFKMYMCISTLLLGIFAIPLTGAELTIDVDVSPGTLNLAYQGQVVTVHTDIPYGDVVSSTVTLNGIEIAWSKADDCGFFVAKFDVADVKTILVEGTVELALSGTTVGADTFSGTDTIRVVSNGGKK